jgi:autotransporter-associated beta strand protein
MFSVSNRRGCARVVVLLLVCIPSLAEGATKTWSATPVTGEWGTGANWVGGVAPVSGDDLVFPADSTLKATNNDLTAGISIGSITFDGNGYTVAGNSIALGAGGLSCTTSAGSQTNTLSLAIIVGATVTIDTVSGCQLNVDGVISGSAGLTKSGGSGNLDLGGANTYAGVTTVSNGRVSIHHATALGFGDGSVGTGTVVSDGAGLFIATSDPVVNERLSITGDGLQGDPALYVGASNAKWQGSVNLDGATRIGNGNAVGVFTIQGGITGPGPLIYSGPETMSFQGTALHPTTTTITGGTLLLNGRLLASSVVSVASGGTLGGDGAVQNALNVDPGGTLAPGNSPGRLETGQVSLPAGSIFAVELNGTAPGTDYDVLRVVNGTVTLGGTLSVTLGYATSSLVSAGDPFEFVIIENHGTDPVIGTFAGLPEGATLDVGGTMLTISYAGGTEQNDVVLTGPRPVPTMGTWAWLLLAAALLVLTARHLPRPRQT